MQVSRPMALTPLTISSTYGMSLAEGCFQAAPMQKRVEPIALARAASSRTFCTSISFSFSRPVL
ncbi:hypothetical protein D3C86_1902970 [compost metagenome]